MPKPRQQQGILQQHQALPCGCCANYFLLPDGKPDPNQSLTTANRCLSNCPQAHALAVDFAVDMIRRLKERLDQKGLTNAHIFVVGSKGIMLHQAQFEALCTEGSAYVMQCKDMDILLFIEASSLEEYKKTEEAVRLVMPCIFRDGVPAVAQKLAQELPNDTVTQLLEEHRKKAGLRWVRPYFCCPVTRTNCLDRSMMVYREGPQQVIKRHNMLGFPYEDGQQLVKGTPVFFTVGKHPEEFMLYRMRLNLGTAPSTKPRDFQYNRLPNSDVLTVDLVDVTMPRYGTPYYDSVKSFFSVLRSTGQILYEDLPACGGRDGATLPVASLSMLKLLNSMMLSKSSPKGAKASLNLKQIERMECTTATESSSSSSSGCSSVTSESSASAADAAEESSPAADTAEESSPAADTA